MILLLSFAFTALFQGGCASNPDNHDPYIGVNKFFYNFNEFLDRNAGEPLSKAYVAVAPKPIRQGLNNAFENLGEPNNMANNLLQGKLDRAGNDLLRFVINSSIGIAGLFDWATEFGLKRSQEDFGQTLAVWGVKPGPYLVLPIFGPSTLRDAMGIPVGIVTDPIFWVDKPFSAAASLGGTRAVDQRATHADAIQYRARNAIDPYLYTREGFLQRRRDLIFDGKPPLESYEEDLNLVPAGPPTPPPTPPTGDTPASPQNPPPKPATAPPPGGGR